MKNKSLNDLENCPVTATMDVIGGKWKLLILHLINNDIRRFGKMSMMLKDISKQMLTTQLRELERDGIIVRMIYAEIPPRVEYSLSPKGIALLKVVDSLKDWGLKYVINEKAGGKNLVPEIKSKVLEH
jgi:DNA-binding HxlR family transcriptional regulator